jgi:type III secretory pathway component EscV
MDHDDLIPFSIIALGIIFLMTGGFPTLVLYALCVYLLFKIVNKAKMEKSLPEGEKEEKDTEDDPYRYYKDQVNEMIKPDAGNDPKVKEAREKLKETVANARRSADISFQQELEQENLESVIGVEFPDEGK